MSRYTCTHPDLSPKTPQRKIPISKPRIRNKSAPFEEHPRGSGLLSLLLNGTYIFLLRVISSAFAQKVKRDGFSASNCQNDLGCVPITRAELYSKKKLFFIRYDHRICVLDIFNFGVLFQITGFLQSISDSNPPETQNAFFPSEKSLVPLFL